MDPYLGEIRIFAGNFAPRGWAFCNGQIMSISQNTALFALLGTMYGGDGKVTFALPNLQMRAPMHYGAAPGLTPHNQGDTGGSDTMTLLSSQMPAHNHAVRGTSDQVSEVSPANNMFGTATGGRGQQGPAMYATPIGTTPVTLAPTSVTVTGGSGPVSKLKPVLVINYIIALQGIFPPRA